MRVQIYWIGGSAPGRLGIMPRPRGGDWLEDEIRSLKMSGVDTVVSLLEREEEAELEITAEEALCDAHGIAYLAFPIPDRSVPASAGEAVAFARSLAGLLREAKSVVIHCRQGVGRSSLIAVCVMTQFGVSADDAFERLERTRGCPVPDTPEQRAWVSRYVENV